MNLSESGDDRLFTCQPRVLSAFTQTHMKTPHLLLAVSIAAATTMAGFAADPLVPAAGTPPADAAAAPAAPGKRQGKAQRPAQIIRAIDADRDHKLDQKEVEELKKQFDANPKGPLGRLDMNANGALEADEIKTINERMAKHGERKKGHRKAGAAKRKRNR